MAAKALSKVLQDDTLIKQLAESIDSVKHYFPLALGRDLLGSQAAVSDIIGWTERDYRYQKIVLECLKTWRNANGKAAGAKLVEIFRGLELDEVVTYLEQELKRRPNCLSEDTFLQSLASQLDCALVYRKLGLPLLENDYMKFNDLICLFEIQTTQHQKDLFHVLSAWRIQAGTSIKSFEELKKILLKHGLKDTAQQLHLMEYGPNAGPMDIPSRTEEMDTVSPLMSTPLLQKMFYDIYLLSTSKTTSYFQKMEKIIERNGWKMTTSFETEFGIPIFQSIENDLSICSHVVYLITKEDCEKENVDNTMTIEMAFKSCTGKGLRGRVIPVFCCDISIVPPHLTSVTGGSIDDEGFEGRLSRSIDVSIRKEREEKYHSVSGKIAELLPGASISQPQQAPHQSTVETLVNVSDRQEFDEKLEAVARKIFKNRDIDYLGRALGFTPVDIHRYIYTNMSSESHMGTLSMLRDWRKKQTEATECEALKYGLERAGLIRLADELFELVQGASSSQPQQAPHRSTEETLENNSGRREEFDDKLITVAKKVVRNVEIDNLGKALGFHSAEIQRYVNTNIKYAHITYMGTLSMLRDWRKQTKATECELALKYGLERAGLIRLADELFST